MGQSDVGSGRSCIANIHAGVIYVFIKPKTLILLKERRLVGIPSLELGISYAHAWLPNCMNLIPYGPSHDISSVYGYPPYP